MAEEKFRIESDLLGELKVPADVYYGVQTQRALNNYHISRKKMCDYPDYVIAIAYVKLAAVQTNHALGTINDEIAGAISQACREIIDGKFHENFPVDMMQGGAGTSVNMNANEVIANRALEIMGHKKGEYQYFYANGGNGCRPTSLGRKIFGFFVSDGEKTQFVRGDFIGIADPEQVPDWVNEKLAVFLEEQQNTEEGGLTLS